MRQVLSEPRVIVRSSENLQTIKLKVLDKCIKEVTERANYSKEWDAKPMFCFPGKVTGPPQLFVR